MLSYCFMCRKNMESKCFYQTVQCIIIKKSRFIKEQEANGLLSSLEIKTPESEISLVGPLLF